MKNIYEKFDDRGLYQPKYTADSEKLLKDFENKPPLDDGADLYLKKYEYLKPAESVDILDNDLRTEKLNVKYTGNEKVGLGLFACKIFKVGDHVFEFDGGRMSEQNKKISSRCGYDSHAIIVGDNRETNESFVYAIPNTKSPLRYLNHSCEPNVARIPGDSFGFVAIKSIKPGEEITADYSLLEANPYWKMENCGCGSSNCRHEIEGVSSLSLESLLKNWNRLTTRMREFAIRYSRDPEISERRDKIGAEKIIETDKRKTYDEIMASKHPTYMRERAYQGAKILTPLFLQEFAYKIKTEDNDISDKKI